MIRSITQLRDWFQRGDKPTQEHFWDLFDSYWHRSEKIPFDTIQNMNVILSNKVSVTEFEGLCTVDEIGEITGVDFCEYFINQLDELQDQPEGVGVDVVGIDAVN